MNARRFWMIFAVLGILAGGVGWMCSAGEYEVDRPSPDDSTLTLEQARWLSERKLVCVKNESSFPLSVDLHTDSGHQFASIHVAAHAYEDKWVPREHFADENTYAVIDATGVKDDAVPAQFRDMITLPNGQTIHLTVASKEGGVTPFAHSARTTGCDVNGS